MPIIKVMSAEEIRELLVKDPFEPFRLRLSSGDSYDIVAPQSVAVMRNRIFVALPGGEKWVFIPFLHIAAIEAASAA